MKNLSYYLEQIDMDTIPDSLDGAYNYWAKFFSSVFTDMPKPVFSSKIPKIKNPLDIPSEGSIILNYGGNAKNSTGTTVTRGFRGNKESYRPIFLHLDKTLKKDTKKRKRQLILLHEMIHVFISHVKKDVFFRETSNGGHGTTFQSILDQLNKKLESDGLVVPLKDDWTDEEMSEGTDKKNLFVFYKDGKPVLFFKTSTRSFKEYNTTVDDLKIILSTIKDRYKYDTDKAIVFETRVAFLDVVKNSVRRKENLYRVTEKTIDKLPTPSNPETMKNFQKLFEVNFV